MIRRPPRSTQSRSSAASDVYKRQGKPNRHLRRLVSQTPLEAGATVTLGDKQIGVVGTAVISPARGPLALAILRREAEPGDDVLVDGTTTARVEEIGA